MKFLPLVFIIFLIAAGCGSKSKEASRGAGDTAVAVAEESAQPDSESASPVDSTADSTGARRRPYALNIGDYVEVFNDSNYIQYASAEKHGISPMYRIGEAYYTKRPVVKVTSGENYIIDNLTHSMPFLVPEAAELLDEIGRDFGTLVEQRGGDRRNRIVVTSLLRSPYTVGKLRRVNRNAVDSSTHMFATTFDIAYNCFYCPDTVQAADGGVLKGILAEVLQKKREEGKCYVKYEQKSPCFHITVK